MHEVKPREVRIYVAENKRRPYLDWLNGLSASVRGIIRSRMNRVRLGNLGDTKSVGDGVHEIRINFGSGYRIYYGLDGDTIVLLLTAGDKSTQTKDIKQAKIYWNDYKENKENYEREL